MGGKMTEDTVHPVLADTILTRFLREPFHLGTPALENIFSPATSFRSLTDLDINILLKYWGFSMIPISMQEVHDTLAQPMTDPHTCLVVGEACLEETEWTVMAPFEGAQTQSERQSWTECWVRDLTADGDVEPNPGWDEENDSQGDKAPGNDAPVSTPLSFPELAPSLTPASMPPLEAPSEVSDLGLSDIPLNSYAPSEAASVPSDGTLASLEDLEGIELRDGMYGGGGYWERNAVNDFERARGSARGYIRQLYATLSVIPALSDLDLSGPVILGIFYRSGWHDGSNGFCARSLIDENHRLQAFLYIDYNLSNPVITPPSGLVRWKGIDPRPTAHVILKKLDRPEFFRLWKATRKSGAKIPEKWEDLFISEEKHMREPHNSILALRHDTFKPLLNPMYASADAYDICEVQQLDPRACLGHNSYNCFTSSGLTSCCGHRPGLQYSWKDGTFFLCICELDPTCTSCSCPGGVKFREIRDEPLHGELSPCLNGIPLQLIFNRDGELHPNPAFFARGEFSNEKQMIQGGGAQFPSLSRGLIRIRMDDTRPQTLRSSGKTLVHFAKFGFRNHFLIFGLSWLRRCSFTWRELEPYRDGTRHIEIPHRKNLQGIETGWSRWLLPVDIDLIHTRVTFLRIDEPPPDTYLFHPDTPLFHPSVSFVHRQRSPRERMTDGTGGRARARPAAFSPDPTQKEPSLPDGTLSPLSLVGDRDERPIWARRTSSPDAPLSRTRPAASFSPPVFSRSPLKNFVGGESSGGKHSGHARGRAVCGRGPTQNQPVSAMGDGVGCSGDVIDGAAGGSSPACPRICRADAVGGAVGGSSPACP
uniref:Uncharacterized protein n=1 Tax=Chromera velia CCMP2878 TaxID=1169474 RepID=A0A0G4FBY8_9ALVE|eukprot:Cvel_16283.t1-p1 / transcript=Cvel_16283.t1 / gene=Cvel_16283 / organism=Chromera_velia_CCMP2878 / gene_product=hypothetical protein / transcript_product=hypothetical protein / location=Cvel_scaffold1247:12323-18766(+) / protein_length=820 / sequence_SO=supercontig / SO=protein_coding / is_pseudo=false